MQYFSIKKAKGNPVQYGIDTTKISKEFIKRYLPRLDDNASIEEKQRKNQEARTELFKLRDEDKGLDINFTRVQPQYYVLANNIARRIDEARREKERERSLLLASTQSNLESEPKSEPKSKPKSEPKSESQPEVEPKLEKASDFHRNLKNLFSPQKGNGPAKEAKAFNAQVTSDSDTNLVTQQEEDTMAGNPPPALKLKDHLKIMPKWEETYRTFESFLEKFEMYFEMCEITADKDKIKLVRYSLFGVRDKEILVDDCAKNCNDNYDTFKNKCIESIDCKIKLDKGKILSKLFKINFLNGGYKDMKAYYQEFVDLKGSAKSGVVIDDKVMMEAFVEGLPNMMRTMLMANPKDTFYEAFAAADKMFIPKKEEVVVAASTSRQPFRPRNGQNFNNNNNSRNQNFNRSGNSGGRNNFSRNNNRNSSNNNNTNRSGGRNNNYQQNSDDSNLICYACDGTGHSYRNCPWKQELIKIKRNSTPRTRVREIRFEHEDNLEDLENLQIGTDDVSGGNAFRGLNSSHKHTCKEIKSGCKTPYKISPDQKKFPVKNHIKSHSELSNNNTLLANTSENEVSNTIHVKNYYVNFSKSVKRKFFLSDSNSQHIKNIPWFAKIDSGAERSVLSLDIVKYMDLKICTDFNFRVIGFDGIESDRVIGYIDKLQFKIPGTSESFTFSPIVIDSPDANLAGMDLIDTAGGGSFVPKKGEKGMDWIFSSEKRVDPSISHKDERSTKIHALSKIDLRPGEIKKIKIENLNLAGLIKIEPNKKKSNLKIVEGLMDNNCNEIFIQNLSGKTAHIHKQQHIGNAMDGEHLDMRKLGEIPYVVDEIDEAKKEKFSAIAKEKIKHLDSSVRSRIYDVLMKHFTVFDEGSRPVGAFPDPVSINPTNQAINVKPEKRRSYNENVWKKINEEIQKLHDLDLVEDCEHVISSPANLVAAKRKGSDRIRLCVDYRRINEQIPDCHFPLPTKEELLSKLGNFDENMVFIKVDVSNMFWNFLLLASERHWTSFYTEHGVLQWKRLPFGLKSAPGLVQKSLSKYIYSNFGLHPSTVTSLFIDDNLYGIKNSEIAIRDLDRILTLYGHLNLKLKISKCDFLVKSTEFMGQKLDVSRNGVTVTANPENIEAIKEIETPNKSEKCLRGFIGMINWISDFLPGIQLSLGPFHNLLSKVKKEGGKLKNLWTENHDKLFKEILEKVGNPRTLGIADFSKGFMLEVDSSGAGHGCCLYQNDRIIAYASKALQKHAVEYENAHRETAGVVWAIEKFSKYFSCSPFPVKVYTDNRVTQFIKSAKSPKLRRWKSYLDSFPNLELIHRAGPEMKISDCLSRLVKEPKGKYVKDVTDELLEEVVIAAGSIESSQLQDFQIHLKNGHCRADRLRAITGKSREYCKDIVKNCFFCQARTKVPEIKQLLGTIPDKMRKNSIWSIDFVFLNGRKYISILDRSTRFFIVSAVDNRSHAGVRRSLARDFLRMGKPEILIADREYVSSELAAFFIQNGIDFKPVSRESPFLNPVERYHQEAKRIALTSQVTMEEAADMLNNLPFSTVPAGMKVKNICPASLFYSNNKQLIIEVCKFLEQESEKRATRSERLRGKNIVRFQRKFEIGDRVKFNLKDGLGFGKVTSKVGNKMYNIKRIDGPNREHLIHAQQLQKLLLSEHYLKEMLKTD